MSSRKNVKDQVPFGLPRIVVTMAYFTVISLTGMASQAADPLQELMRLNEAYLQIGNEKDRGCAIVSIVGFGLSCSVLSGIVAGPLIDVIGAKLMGLLGLLLHALGYIFLFFMEIPVLYYASGICFGAAFQFILNSHLSVACLFPKNSNLILTIVCAGCDVSLFFPYSILGFAESYAEGPAGVRKAVIQYLIVCVGAAAVLDAFLLPWRPFAVDSNVETQEQNLSLLSDNQESERVIDKSEADRQSSNEQSDLTPSYWKLSLMQQLATADYWLFVAMLIFSFCRKKHYSVLIRPIIAEAGSDDLSKTTANFYVNMFNRIVPLGFIPGIVWGAVADRFGINVCLVISNTLGTLFIALSLIPVLQLQILTIGIYIVYQSFILAQGLAFTGSVYGMRTVTTLQGICCSLIGVVSLLMDFLWDPFIVNTLGSYRRAGFILLAMSGFMFIIPIVLTRKANRRATLDGLTVKFGPSEESFENLFPPSPIFDRRSLSVLRLRQSRSVLDDIE